MEGNIFEALKLLVVGLLTVFVVLLLVMGTGNVLISFVNKFIGPDEQPKKAASQPAAVNPKVAEAISLAVRDLTGGKGKVEKIEKL